jgi:hypothetical protein
MKDFLTMRPPRNNPINLGIDLIVPYIRLQSIQSILSSQEADNLKEPFEEPRPSAYLPAHTRIVSVVDTQLVQITASGILGSATRPLKLGGRRASLTLSTYDSHLLAGMHRKGAKLSRPLVELTVADSYVSFGKANQTHLGNVQVTFQAEAPAPILATLSILSRIIEEIKATSFEWTGVGIARARFIIGAVLDATDKAQSDPLSRAVTSHLVQSGRPHQLRSDICWKILNHARQRLPWLSPDEYNHILEAVKGNKDNLPTMTDTDIAIIFKRAWKEWTSEILEDEVEDLALFRLLFQRVSRSLTDSAMQPISIRTGLFQFNLEDTKGVGSKVRIGPFHIEIAERRSGITVLNAIGSSVSLGRLIGGNSTQQTFRHIGIVCDLGTFHVDLSPSLLPFAGRTFRAYHFLTPSPRSPTSPVLGLAHQLPSTKSSMNTFVIDMSLHFRDLTVISRAYNFAFEFSLRRPTLALHSRLGSLSPRPFFQLTADTAGSVSCAWESCRLRVTDDIEPRTQTVLAEFDVRNLNANAAWFSRNRERPIVRVSLVVGRVYFSIPRHLARLLQSVERWWDDYFLCVIQFLCKEIYLFDISEIK